MVLWHLAFYDGIVQPTRLATRYRTSTLLRFCISMSTHQLHTDHQRSFLAYRYVYPVLSRRSGGMSLGVNLNPDKVCNFDCIYCQVDRTTQSETRFVGMEQLLDELRELLTVMATGEIYDSEKFRNTPPELRRLNDIAFSGDGEPTTYKNFDEIIAACAEIKRDMGLDDVKMVLITNASMFHRPHVERGMQVLDANRGEVWAKLDAGTEAYYHRIERTPIPFRQILENITRTAKIRPLVIQSLFMRVHGEPPTTEELTAFCDRLAGIVAAGGQLSYVQIYTVARRPAESYVAPLEDAEVDQIAARVRERAKLPVMAFYGSEAYQAPSPAAH